MFSNYLNNILKRRKVLPKPLTRLSACQDESKKIIESKSQHRFLNTTKVSQNEDTGSSEQGFNNKGEKDKEVLPKASTRLSVSQDESKKILQSKSHHRFLNTTKTSQNEVTGSSEQGFSMHKEGKDNSCGNFYCRSEIKTKIGNSSSSNSSVWQFDIGEQSFCGSSDKQGYLNASYTTSTGKLPVTSSKKRTSVSPLWIDLTFNSNGQMDRRSKDWL